MKKFHLSKKIIVLLVIIVISVPIALTFIIRHFNQPDPIEVTDWVQTNGPFGGLIHTIEIDPNQPNVIYAGGAGGIFKSYDSGVTWSNLPRFL